jgi:MFS family permease
LALMLGLLALGPLERRARSRRRLVAALAALACATLVALALWPQPPRWAAAALLVGLCLFSCFPVVVVAQARALFPDHLVGRGATTVNLAQVVGSAALPVLVGAVVGLFPELPGGARPEMAYRAGFAVLAAALGLGLAGYLAGRDAARSAA